MRRESLMLAMAIVAIAVFCSNCCLCIDYFAPPMQWHNFSSSAAPNVTILMNVYTLGPQPITFLDAGSDRINFSTYAPLTNPAVYTRTNDSRLELYFWMPGNSDISPGFKSDTYVYLPCGPNYTVYVGSIAGEKYRNESKVTNDYTGGNITLVVNDWEQMPQAFSGATLTPLQN